MNTLWAFFQQQSPFWKDIVQNEIVFDLLTAEKN